MLNCGWYLLDENGIPSRAPFIEIENGKLNPEYAEYLGWLDSNRRLTSSYLKGYLVSTVFLGLDHSFGDSAPILWETMIFNNEGDSVYCERYGSQADALIGHKHAREVARWPRRRKREFYQ